MYNESSITIQQCLALFSQNTTIVLVQFCRGLVFIVKVSQCLLTPTGGVNNCHKLTIDTNSSRDHYVVHISPEAYSYRPIDVLNSHLLPGK